MLGCLHKCGLLLFGEIVTIPSPLFLTGHTHVMDTTATNTDAMIFSAPDPVTDC